MILDAFQESSVRDITSWRVDLSSSFGKWLTISSIGHFGATEKRSDRNPGTSGHLSEEVSHHLTLAAVCLVLVVHFFDRTDDVFGSDLDRLVHIIVASDDLSFFFFAGYLELLLSFGQFFLVNVVDPRCLVFLNTIALSSEHVLSLLELVGGSGNHVDSSNRASSIVL